jgi:hypothetical protein
MRDFLKACGLDGEQINMVEVFMLLYGYATIEELMAKTNEELTQHKGWDVDIENCINKIRSYKDSGATAPN